MRSQLRGWEIQVWVGLMQTLLGRGPLEEHGLLLKAQFIKSWIWVCGEIKGDDARVLTTMLPIGFFGTWAAGPKEHSRPKHIIDTETCHGGAKRNVGSSLIGLQNKNNPI